MAADFKSHVLRRDEKGVFGIPFKRLLLAGCGGGLTYTIINLVLRGWSIPLAIGVVILVIVLTSPRGGIPLWWRLVYRVRGTLLIVALHEPDSVSAQVAQLLNLRMDLMRLNGSVVFAPPDENRGELDLREWVIYAEAEAEDGLVFVDSPMGGV